MRGFLTDIKLAVRSLSATRWTTGAAVLILALGTGVNTAVLAVAYGILLRPLPYAEPSRLVVIGPGGQDGQVNGVPAGEFDEWRSRLRTVDRVSAYSAGEFTIRGAGEPRVVRTAIVKGDFFALMGVPAEAGRFPSPGEDDWVAVGASLARQLPSDRSLIGSGMTVGQAGYTVAAIVPDRFTFPADDVALWLPSSSRTALGFAARPDARTYRLIARLKPGVTLEQTRDDVARVLRDLRPAGSAGDRRPRAEDERATVTTLDEAVTGRVKPILGALLAAALLVLLVACGNVASLFIGRAAGAQQDLAVRVALGATRWRIVRGVLAESLVVAGVAATAGAGIGLGLVRLFVGVAAGILPRLDAVAVDAPVIAAAGSRGIPRRAAVRRAPCAARGPRRPGPRVSHRVGQFVEAGQAAAGGAGRRADCAVGGADRGRGPRDSDRVGAARPGDRHRAAAGRLAATRHERQDVVLCERADGVHQAGPRADAGAARSQGGRGRKRAPSAPVFARAGRDDQLQGPLRDAGGVARVRDSGLPVGARGAAGARPDARRVRLRPSRAGGADERVGRPPSLASRRPARPPAPVRPPGGERSQGPKAGDRRHRPRHQVQRSRFHGHRGRLRHVARPSGRRGLPRGSRGRRARER